MRSRNFGTYLLCALLGLQFTGMGAAMIVGQLIVGEGEVDVARPDVPLGLEFAFVPFSFGQLFLYLGLSNLVKKRHSAVVLGYLALANGLCAAVGFAGMFLGAVLAFGDIFWSEAMFWTLAMVVANRKAKQDPEYVHAQELEALTWAHRKSRTSGLERAASSMFRSKSAPGLSPPLKAGVIGACVLPMLTTGLFALLIGGIDPLFYCFLAAAAVAASPVGFCLGYMFRAEILGALSRRRRAFAALAERVHGKIITASQFGVTIPTAVEFTYRNSPCRLEDENRVRGSGETKTGTIYTHLRLRLPRPVPAFRISAYDEESRRGGKDVVLGRALFDDLFSVYLVDVYAAPSEEATLRQVLNFSVQESLLRFKRWAWEVLGSDDLELRATSRQPTLTLTIKGAPANSEKLILQFLDHCIEIYDGVSAWEPRGPASEEELREPRWERRVAGEPLAPTESVPDSRAASGSATSRVQRAATPRWFVVAIALLIVAPMVISPAYRHLRTKATGQEYRTLTFPRDWSQGRLTIRDWDSQDEWQYLAEARGDVTVPAGKELRLIISADGSADLSPLADLEPDTLQELIVLEGELGDGDLEHMAHLRFLRKARLMGRDITDMGVAHIAELENLESLALYNSGVTDDGLALLAQLPLLHLSLDESLNLTDAGLQVLVDMHGLKGLSLDFNPQLTDALTQHASGLACLEGLYLSNTQLTDEGLACLQELTNLRALSLEETQVTDDGLQALHGMRSLRRLWLCGTGVTEAGVARLQQVLPRCQVILQGAGAEEPS